MDDLLKLLAIVVAAAIGLYLAWDWLVPSGKLRYRMTVEVEAGGKVYTGSGVIEVRYTITPRWMPSASSVVPSVRGEAVVVDLGERGVLFALLRGDWYPDSSGYKADAADIPDKEFKLSGPHGIDESVVRKMGSLRARAEIPRSRLPMLVRFRNLDDPKSVERVDPGSLDVAFGPDARLLRVTVETTRDSVTKGIETRLKWLKGLQGYLDGRPISMSRDLANTLSGPDFRWGL